MEHAPTISEYEGLLRLVLAVLCGAAVGLEREARDRTAGFRTHILVCLGSALFTIISAYGYTEWWMATRDSSTVMDPARIAAQIVAGIGFLGAGAILRSGTNVKGLTTAAALWVVAAIGMAIGIGSYVWAIGTTVLVVIVLMFLRKLGHRLVNHDNNSSYNIKCQLVSNPAQLDTWLATKDLNYELVQIISTHSGFDVTYRVLREDDTEAMQLLSELLDQAWAAHVEIKNHSV